MPHDHNSDREFDTDIAIEFDDVRQSSLYISAAGSSPEAQAQADFKAYWRDRVDYDPNSQRRAEFEFTARPSKFNIAAANAEGQFAARAETLGLEPQKTWDEIAKAAAYLRNVQNDDSYRTDLSSGFTEHDRTALTGWTNLFKNQWRDDILDGYRPTSFYASRAHNLGLDFYPTQTEVVDAARFVAIKGITEPNPGDGFIKEHRDELRSIDAAHETALVQVPLYIRYEPNPLKQEIPSGNVIAQEQIVRPTQVSKEKEEEIAQSIGFSF